MKKVIALIVASLFGFVALPSVAQQPQDTQKKSDKKVEKKAKKAKAKVKKKAE
jgi:hypothetical protein